MRTRTTAQTGAQPVEWEAKEEWTVIGVIRLVLQDSIVLSHDTCT